MHVDPYAALVLMLGPGTLLALVAQRLGVGALTAYLVTGLIAGPSAMGWVDQQVVAPMAEISAVLLLFALGLELDLGSMARHAGRLSVASSLQIGLTVGAGWLAAVLLGQPGTWGIALGACFSLSSTLLLLRVLDERRLRNREEGQLALGLCLFQDVAIGPLLVLLSLLLPVGERPSWLVLSGGVLGLVVVTVTLRQVLATRLVERIRATKLPELETALAIVAALGAAWFASATGVGAAAGAFCAGLAFGKGEHRRTIEHHLAPLLGLASICFFIAIGIDFDLRWVLDRPLLVVGAFLLVVLGKAVIASFAFRIAGLSVRAALGTGILSANIGEFAIVLAASAFAVSTDPVISSLHRLVVSVTVLSFLAMPLIVLAARPFLPRPRSFDVTRSGRTIVVAGLGPVGNTVVTTLRAQGWPLFLVDRNHVLLKPWAEAPGVTIHQGRIEDMDDWLPALGHRPALVVLTFPIPDASAVVASRLRAIDPDLPIIARSPFQAQIGILQRAGVRQVICDEQATAQALLPLIEAALQESARLDNHTSDPESPASPKDAPIV